MMTSSNAQLIQPNLPIVYAEPVEFEDILFAKESEEVLRVVNVNADMALIDRIKRTRIKRRRISSAITAALFSLVTFFTAVGIHACFIAIFG